MNSYTLTDKLRKARRKSPLTATAQALYHELVSLCNESEWPDVFSCSNDELCGALSVTDNTLKAARDSLIAAELIYYKCGKSKKVHGLYSFTKALTTSNIETVEPPTTSISTSKIEDDSATVQSTVAGTTSGTPSGSTSKSEDYYINKTKQNRSRTTARKKIEFVPPTVDEVLEYFRKNGMSDQSARKAHKHYADLNWFNSKGKKVKDWEATMRKVWFTEENEARGGTIVQMPVKSSYNPLDPRNYYNPKDYEEALEKLNSKKNVS